MLVVGYSPEMIGGVTTVMNALMEGIPYLDLHPALRWHRPRWKSLAFSLCSVSTFLLRLVFTAPRVIQIIVGSRGDAVRMLPYIVLAKLRRSKVCLHFHKNRDAIFGDLPSVIRRIVLATWRRADGYCFLSNRLRDEYGGQFGLGKPCVVIPNPISAEWLRQDVLSRTERTRGLVFLGRWSHEKGKEELLSVMRTFNGARPERCDIYSDNGGPVETGNCVFHNWLGANEVRQVLRESTILLLPSHAEAFPTVLLEAAACGTPFVASNIAGIPDIAEQSQAGLLHEVGDVEGMREAITRLLTDRALWAECSDNGRRWVESLEVSRIVPLWHQFYQGLGMKTQDLRKTPCGACRKVKEPCITSDGERRSNV